MSLGGKADGRGENETPDAAGIQAFPSDVLKEVCFCMAIPEPLRFNIVVSEDGYRGLIRMSERLTPLATNNIMRILLAILLAFWLLKC